MKRTALVLLVLASLLANFGSVAVRAADPPATAIEGSVNQYWDGDKIGARLGDSQEFIHLIGVDAPEKNKYECGAFEAFDFVRATLPVDTPIKVAKGTKDRDKAGNLWGIVWYQLEDGSWTTLNESVLYWGWGRYETPDAENDTFGKQLRAAQRTAKKNGSGIWNLCDGGENHLAQSPCQVVNEWLQTYISSAFVSTDEAWLRGFSAVRSQSRNEGYIIAADIEGPAYSGTERLLSWFMVGNLDVASGVSPIILALNGEAKQYTPAFDYVVESIGDDLPSGDERDPAYSCVRDGLSD